MRKNEYLCLNLRFVLFALALLLVSSAVGCSKTVNTYVWQTPTEPTAQPEQIYPELDKNPGSPYFKETAYIRDVKPKEDEKSKKNKETGKEKKLDLGIAFSGGGTRSASATIGQLRALNELGWLQRVRYVSAVSGGAWGSMPFLFANDPLYEKVYQRCKKNNPDDADACVRNDPEIKKMNEELNKQLLGTYIKPNKLTEELLCHRPDENELLYNMSHAHIGFHMPWAWIKLKADESYADALQAIFLDNPGIKEDFFTFSRSVRDGIIKRNPALQGMEEEFTVLRPGMPFPIINAVLFSKRTSSMKKDIKPASRVFPLEITPIYVGFGKHFPRMGYSRTACTDDYSDIGGGWIETFAYDSRPPDESQVCEENNSQALEENIPITSDKEKTQAKKSKAGRENPDCAAKRKAEKKCTLDCRRKDDNKNRPGECPVKLLMARNHFTLADAIAASGAAPQETITSIPVAKHGFLENLGFPEFNHWPASGRVFRGQKMSYADGDCAGFDECSQALSEREKQEKGDVLSEAHDDESFEKKPEYAHGDGGHYDYFGLLPLISRGVENIIVFVNTPNKFKPLNKLAGDMAIKRDSIRKVEINNERDQWSPEVDVPGYDDEYKAAKGAGEHISNANMESDIVDMFRKNKKQGTHIAVFHKDGERRLQELHDSFLADRQSGAPMIHCAKYRIDPADFGDNMLRTAITKDYSPNICWVYLDAPEKWFKELRGSQLLPQTIVDLYFGAGEFDHFPHYWTFVQGASEMPGTIINLSQKQANALAELAAWTVMEGAGEIAAQMKLPLPKKDKSGSKARAAAE